MEVQRRSVNAEWEGLGRDGGGRRLAEDLRQRVGRPRAAPPRLLDLPHPGGHVRLADPLHHADQRVQALLVEVQPPREADRGAQQRGDEDEPLHRHRDAARRAPPSAGARRPAALRGRAPAHPPP
eukprot:gene9662-biopygen1259